MCYVSSHIRHGYWRGREDLQQNAAVLDKRNLKESETCIFLSTRKEVKAAGKVVSVLD
jgi:hypothetical protein